MIRGTVPDRIALLRTDTDWYASMTHQLGTPGERLEPGGVLIVDDHSHGRGRREAVDESVAGLPDAPLLTHVDYTRRIEIKR
jgi:O-methyltransferase